MRGRESQGPETDRWERKDWWGIYLEAPDPHVLLAFWSAILDKPIHSEDEEGGALDFVEGVAYLAVQKADVYEPPVWPPSPGARACSCTSRSRSRTWRPRSSTRSSWARRWRSASPRTTCACMLDPAGHPFCLYT